MLTNSNSMIKFSWLSEIVNVITKLLSKIIAKVVERFRFDYPTSHWLSMHLISESDISNAFEYVLYSYSNVVSECVHTGQAETFAWPRWESNLRPLVCYSIKTFGLLVHLKIQNRKNILISKELIWVLKYHSLEPTWHRSSVSRALD